MSRIHLGDGATHRRLVAVSRPGASDKLAVCLNGYASLAYGAPELPFRTRFEGFRRLEAQDADLIWFAEEWGTWYLEHQIRILHRLTAYILDHGIRTVKFVGNSAGGYAGIRFAVILDSLLGALGSQAAVLAFAVNPQTGFRPTLIDSIRAACRSEGNSKGEIGINPALLDEERRRHYGGEALDLAHLLRDHRPRNLAIVTLYDSANPIEKGFCADLPQRDFIALIEEPVGLHHTAGCDAIWRGDRLWESFDLLLPFGHRPPGETRLEALSWDPPSMAAAGRA